MAACERLEDRTLLSAVGPELAGAAGQTLEIGVSPVVDDDRIPPLNEERIASQIPASAAAPPFDLGGTFQLHSNPGATKVIYLDFDGHTTTGTAWNNNVNPGSPIVTPAYSFEGDVSANFTDGELERIQKIWQRVAEDFIPFDVDVTTEDPGTAALRNTGGSDNEWGVRVAIGGSWSDWYGTSAGGVAYVGIFGLNQSNVWDAPAFVFEDNTGNGNEKSTAEAISHEVGHTLGLNHDGTSTVGYYEGHGSGATGWAPIMGVGYYQELSQWSQGEYSGADNTEDDLQIITATDNGFGYRTDDHGDTQATATAVNQSGNQIDAAGIIEQNTDVDVFSFTSTGGQIELDILPFVNGPNLDILAELYNSAGALIATSNPAGVLNASFDLTLVAGEYFLHIDGTGEGDPLDTGYTDYGSLGAYTVTGTILPPDDPTANDAPVANPDSYTVSEDGILTVVGTTGGDPLLRYKFDESASGSGDAIDSGTAPATNGTLAGSATRTGNTPGSGSIGALDLSATGTSYVTAGDLDEIDALTEMTITLWINLQADPTAGDRLLSDLPTDPSSGVSTGWELYITNNSDTDTLSADRFAMAFFVNEDFGGSGRGNGRYVNGISADGQWAFFAITYDRVLDDGVPRGLMGAWSGDTDSAVAQQGLLSYFDVLLGGPNGSELRIGENSLDPVQNPEQSPPAWLDDIRIYDRPLTQQELEAVRQEGLTRIAAGVLANDTDTDGDSLTAQLVTEPQHGSVQLNSDGSFTYTPDANYVGTDSFTYKANDGQSDSNVATVSITVEAAANEPPLAVDDAATTGEDTPVTINVLDNDSDAEGHTLTVISVSDPAGGTAVINSDGTITFTPDANFNGPDSFTYTVSDGDGGTDTATVSITVEESLEPLDPDNILVTLHDDFGDPEQIREYTLDGTLVRIFDPQLINDDWRDLSVDVEGNIHAWFDPSSFDSPTALKEIDPTTGDVETHELLNGWSTFGAGSGGVATLNNWVFVTDKGTPSDTDRGIIRFDRTTGTSVRFATEDAAYGFDDVAVGLDGLLYGMIGSAINVYDPATMQKLWTVDRQGPSYAIHGIAINAAGEIFATGWGGTIFKYDGQTGELLASSEILVDSYAGLTDINVRTDGMIVAGSTRDGHVVVTNEQFSSVTKFTLPSGGALATFVAFAATPQVINLRPFAYSSTVTTNEETAYSGNIAASDPEGSPLTYALIDGPDRGMFTFSTDGTFSYTPEENFNGSVSFTFTVSDGTTTSYPGTVTISVDPINDEPTLIVNDGLTHVEGNTTQITEADLQVTDVDDSPSEIRFVIEQLPEHGALLLYGNALDVGDFIAQWHIDRGEVTYRHDGSETTSDLIRFTYSDGQSPPRAIDFVVTVTPDGAPTTVNDTITTAEDTAVTIDVLANDSAEAGGALTVTAVSDPPNGSATINADGTITFTPDAEYHGSGFFSYTITESGGGTDSGTVWMTVSSVNDEPPDAVDDAFTLNENTPILVQLLDNDSDFDGDRLSIIGLGDPAHGSAELRYTGQYLYYEPDPDFHGTDTFTYTISDGNGGTDTAIVTMTVAPANDAPTAENDTATTNEDTSVTIDVLANDSDADGDPLTVTAMSDPTNGTVTLSSDGTIIYTPDINFNGTDSFTYTISDSRGGTDTATVSITVEETPESTLIVTVDPSSIHETDGAAAATGTVTRSGDLSQAVVIELTSSDPSEVAVPETVTIQAGEVSATFSIDAVDDRLEDGTQTVTITATMSTSPGSGTVELVLDESFGGDGTVDPSGGTTDVALGPDGKIVVVGYQQINDPQNPENHRDLLITRYHGDGSLDTTFGGDGTVTTDVTGEIDEPHAVAVQSDGKILVGGHVYNGPSRDWLLVRYNVDGSLDTTFGGGDGIVITDPGDGSDHIHDLLILPDGKIVVAGDINSDEAFGTSDSYDDFAVARYNANGTLDTSFADDGIATTQFAGRRSDTAFALARQADGKIVLAGTTGGGNFDSEFALVRYNTDGTRDSSFGGNGSVTVDVPGEYERGFDLLIQSDGKIVVVGQVGKAGTSPPNYDTALTRLNPDGTLDLSFGADGFVVSDLGAGDAANGVALTNDGRIVIAGPGLALYNSDGTLQANDSSIPTGQNLVVLPDGRILVAGTTVLERYRIIQSISDTATIDVLDVPENDAPDANSDEVVTDQGQAVTIDVLANDFDLDGDRLTVTDVSDPNGGTATINTDGTITFTPDPDFAGTTQFEYTVSDGKGGTSQATVYLSIYGPAEIRGMVWNDLDGDGIRDTGEPGLANRTVYLDLNDNGIRDQTSRLGIDPGDFPRQTILSDLLPQATLSAIDGQGTVVAPVNALGGRSLSSPADIFGHASDTGAEDVLWSTGFRELRIDFHVPVRSVSIDVRGYGSSSRGRLSLYDANGNLIDSYVSDVLGRQVFQTMTLSATVDIAYAIVGADNSVLLDDLRFTAITPEPTATTDANGDYIFTDILPGEYVVRQELPEGVTQTAPHNENGDFYGVHATRLYKINAVTGEVQRIGPQDGQTPIHGLAYTNAGKLFGLRSLGNDPPSLFEIDLATGVATVIGPIGRPVRSGLAYDHNTDTLYGLGGHDDGTTGLLILNRNTGAATPFGEGVATGINAVSGVAFDAANNRVIAFDNYDDEFWAFDVNTGAATLLGNIAPFAGYGFTETDTALVMQFANSQDGGERFVAVNPDNGTFSHFLTLDDAIGTFEALEFVAGDPYAHHIDLAPGQTATAINFGNQDINDPPVANPSSFSTDEDTPYSGNVTGSDPESQALTYSLVTGSTHGEMELNPDGSFTYTPNDNFQGTDFFTFTVSDGNLTSSPATVSITVGAVNDAPLFAASSYDFSIAENSAAGTPVGTTAATDADGDSLVYSITAGNDAGAFAINAATGEITVADASALDFETTPSFTLTVQATDGTLTGQATVAITLTDVVAAQVAGVDFGYGQDQWANTESLQGRTAPWQITRVRVRFTQDVLVDINDLVITGTNGNYAFSDFTYNATTFTAVWTLATPIEQDRVTMNLDWEPAAADGNEAMSAGSEELIEDELSAELDVLYGDVSDDGMVDLWDALLMRTRNTTSDPWADINGDGIVDLTDALLLRTRNGTHLP